METEPVVAATLSLPDDALSVVLARLPAHSLAASRRVCVAWRDLIDERRLLAPLLLPRSVGGLLLNYYNHRHPHLFARPSATLMGGGPPRHDSKFIDEPSKRSWVLDHCGGLVLYTNSTAALYVCNPATRRWARLPDCSAGRRKKDWCAYLAFDPATSPCYQVLVPSSTNVPVEPYGAHPMDWPSPWAWHVFSSRKGGWGYMFFVREGEPVGIFRGLRANICNPASGLWFSATYWQGTLYVQFGREHVLRMSLSGSKYRVIRSPIYQDDSYIGASTYLGKSEKGMCFATVHHGHCKLRVWVLNELGDEAAWVPTHQIDLKPCVWWAKTMEAAAADGNLGQQGVEGSWLLDDCCNFAEAAFHWPEYESEWDSDNDDVVAGAPSPSDEELPLWTDWKKETRGVVYRILGFHPYKDVVFLYASYVGLAYHLNSSKVQHLGNLRPHESCIGPDRSFVYTPCMIGDL
ncbi:hypothetical protein EJB05_56895, partial [Eragrostis curvula]